MKIKVKQNLMQNALDGSLNEKDKQEWEELLQSDPQVQNEYRIQKEMADLLQNAAVAEPPDDLTQTVMRAVHINERIRINKQRVHVPAFSLSNVRLKYAASFAAGMALALLLLMTVNEAALFQQRAPQNMSGTLYDVSSGEQHAVLDLASVQGELAWRAHDQLIEIRLSLDPSLISSIQFEYAAEAVVLKSMINEGDAPFIDLNVTSEQTTWQCTQPCRYRLTFSSDNHEPAVINFQLKQNEQIVFSHEIK